MVGVADDYDDWSRAPTARAEGDRHRYPDAPELSARASPRPRRSAIGIPGPASWSSRSTTTPSTPFAADRGRRGIRVPAQGPRRRGRPARTRDPRGRDRRLDDRPARSCRRWSTRSATRADATRRAAAAARGRKADQGDRRRADDPRGGRRRGRCAVPQPGHRRQSRRERAFERLQMLHSAIVEREEQGERSAACCRPGWPTGPPGRRRDRRDRRRSSDRPDVRRARLLGDRGARGPGVLARQLNAHRAEMTRAISAREER